MRRCSFALAALLIACSSPRDPNSDEEVSSAGGSSGSIENTGSAGAVLGSGGGAGSSVVGGTSGTMANGSGGSSTGGKGGSSAQGGSNAGGSSAGGSGGSGGMHVASPCSALPGAGTWEKFPRPVRSKAAHR